MPLQATSGAASYDAFGGGVAAVPQYIEDVFSTYLYGTSATSVPNGIDISGKGALIWLKSRANDAGNMNNALFDSARGFSNILYSNTTGAQIGPSGVIASTSNNGFTLGGFNDGSSYASWTFRKQPKFFDVVTYTGNDTAGRTIAHYLGSVPGCIIVKPTNSPMNWFVYHRSLGNTKSINLNLTSAATTVDNWGNTTPTSTVFTVDSGSETNQSGVTYVAYLFAHNAGGFGLTGTDNVISCGSYTGTGTVGNKITLGYEPQWLLIKRTDTANSWYLFDTMRGLSLTQSLALLPNGTNSDLDYGSSFQLNADGVTQNNANSAFNASGGTYIYIAIRRGPMKVPTSGASVFSPVAYTGTGTTKTVTTGFVTDLVLGGRRNQFDEGTFDRLRGKGNCLVTSNPNAESGPTIYDVNKFDIQDGFGLFENFNASLNAANQAIISWNFKRAPNFFDEVCYTGTGSARTINHNLGVAPELMIVKARVSAGGANRNWAVYASSLGAGTQAWLNTSDAAFASSTIWANTSPTASVFSVSTNVNTNYSGATYVAYLFATCPGVSKVGSYTGNGTTQTINCGFTSGARFILIRKTNDTQSWYVFDSARGIVSGNDPVLLLNTTDSEFTAYDSVDPNSTGFVVNSDLIGLNDSGGNYIFLAIA